MIVESGIDNEQATKDNASGELKPDSNCGTCKDATTTRTGGIRFMIKHILYKDQIRNLIEKQLWPQEDPEFQTELSLGLLSTSSNNNIDDIALPTKGSDGIVYECDYSNTSEDNDDELFVNTNRVAALNLDESSSEEDE